MKPRKKYRPRLVKIPMCRPLHDEFAMQMHTALATLRTAPTIDAYDALGWIINLVGVAYGDRMSEDQSKVIGRAVEVMNQLVHTDLTIGAEIVVLEHCAVMIDDVLPYISVTDLHLANLKLKEGL